MNHTDPRLPFGGDTFIDNRPWGSYGDTGFVKEGSVVGMELGRDGNDLVTLTIYIDGHRLGELVTPEDHELAVSPIPAWPSPLRWCGYASEGAALRIDGPKPPASG